jgi:hypothetical protein
MTRRPERLKATKLYGSENVADQPKAPGENGNKLTNQNPSTTNKNQLISKSLQTGIVDKEVPMNSNTDTTSKPVSTQQKHGAKLKYSKIQPTETGEENLKSNWVNGLPKGFVTRTEMEQRVNRNNFGVGEKQLKSQSNEAGALSYDKSNNNAISKGHVQSKIPSGFVTLKDMETRIKNRKTKSTKLTPLYPEEETDGTLKIPSVNFDRDPRIKTKPNPNGIHVFSKLENIKDEAIETDEVKQTDTRLPKRNKAGVNNALKMAKVSKSNNPAVPMSSENEEAVITLKEIEKQKGNHFSDTNEQGRRESGDSGKQPSITITPRMTSTAIPKAPRNNAQANSLKSDTFESVKIMLMNANGKNDKGGTPTERRKNAIQNVILKHSPKIVLFQEFSWKGITGKTWAKYPFPEHYVYKGHYDASIMYDSSCITVKDLLSSDIQTILSGLQSSANNRLKRTFPMDFNPVARMCLSRVSTPSKPALDFICISWHGKSNENGGGRMKELKKIEYFEYWMEFLRHIREKYKLPIVAGGDYNVDMYSIETYVTSPFKLCIYETSMRRTVRGIVDYCIVTDDLDFTEISWVNLDRDTSVYHPNEILDHDPIVGSLSVSLLGASDVKLGMKKSWPSPIVKPT